MCGLSIPLRPPEEPQPQFAGTTSSYRNYAEALPTAQRPLSTKSRRSTASSDPLEPGERQPLGSEAQELIAAVRFQRHDQCMKQTRNRLLALAFVGMCTSSCAHRESRENLELLAVQFQHSVMDLLPVPPAQKADQVEAAPRDQPLT